MKIGIIKEGKIPVDHRVPFTPEHCKALKETYGVEVVVQPSPIRCYKDEEYSQAGISLQEDINDCDLLVGVKEVPLESLIPNKTYFFFSHTIKKQLYNKILLQTVLSNNIRLIDYECLREISGKRVVAFGRWAGIVGAYNGLITYGKKYKTFGLKPANECFDLAELHQELKKVTLPNIKIVLTGGGRVSQGAMEILDKAGIVKVNVEDFLSKSYDKAVYCQLETSDYNKPINGGEFIEPDFYTKPHLYTSNFERFTKVSDLLIAGAYWDPKAPTLYSKEDTQKADFKIKVIADITCDIEGSIPTTVKPSTIADPFYDYNPSTLSEDIAFSKKDNISVMAVDNLPCELPRDASKSFGDQLLKNVMPNLLGHDETRMIHRGAITTTSGELNEDYIYLSDYIA